MSWALCLTNGRPSSTRQIAFSARPTAPNAPEAPYSDVAIASTSAVSAVPRFSCAPSSAPVTASIVSLGAPTEMQEAAALRDQALLAEEAQQRDAEQQRRGTATAARSRSARPRGR